MARRPSEASVPEPIREAIEALGPDGDGRDVSRRLVRAWDAACDAAATDLGVLEAFTVAPLQPFVSATGSSAGLSALGQERLLALGRVGLEASASGTDSVAAIGRRVLGDLLEHGNRRELMAEVNERDRGAAWLDFVDRAAAAIDYTTASLLERRVERYTDETLFRVLRRGAEEQLYSYGKVGALVRQVGAAVHALLGEVGSDGPVAILARNSLEMALVDLACLTTGVRNVLIPTTASPAHTRVILEHSGSVALFAGSPAEARRAYPPGKLGATLKRFVLLGGGEELRGRDVLAWDAFVGLGEDGAASRRAAERGAAQRYGDVASLMYTSGTTGLPKGIPFRHRNIVSKRFARAVALPGIGPGDRFLSYLPLCHTFGRWFEMMGSIFWGATYAFLPGPARRDLLEGFESVRPSIFISVPSKWVELHDEVLHRVDVERAEPEDVKAAVEEVTGGELRWGLSAAGRLEPHIFRFFQKNGVELLSGYGLTEATGGVSMTPPGDFRDDSVGIPLPGIDAQLAEDGELKLRGPYVIDGYYRPLPEDDTVRDGWLFTGDVFHQDDDGHLFFRERKKDMYKNSKGQTIAPGPIESMFEGFEEIAACFVVGDGRPFNTALIYPNFDYQAADFREWDEARRREYFRTIVVSVNRFLDASERVVSFALVDRDFSRELGERTEKGSFCRATIVDHFRDVVTELYEARDVAIEHEHVEVRVPVWLLRELGVTSDALRFGGDALEAASVGRLVVETDPTDRRRVRVGSLWYELDGNVIDLDIFFRSPALWVGNVGLVTFAGEGIFEWTHRSKAVPPGLRASGWAEPALLPSDLVLRFHEAVTRAELSVRSVHLAFSVLLTNAPELQREAVRFLGTVLREGHGSPLRVARERLQLAAHHHERTVRRLAFMCLGTVPEETGFAAILDSFWGRLDEILDDDMLDLLIQVGLGYAEIEALLAFLAELREKDDPRRDDRREVEALLRLVARFGGEWISTYAAIRRALVSWALSGGGEMLEPEPLEALGAMTAAFHRKLGKWEPRVAHPDTGEPYGWDEVVVFEEGISPGDRERIRGALERTSLLPEALTLLCAGDRPHGLRDIPRGGVWVSFQDFRNGRSHYRITLRTRAGTRHDFVVTLYSSHVHSVVEREILWLIRLSGGSEAERLVESVGGLYTDFALWTAAMSRGETVHAQLMRGVSDPAPEVRRRVKERWASLLWSGLEAYVEYWKRSERRWRVAGPSPSKVIVPSHDYLSGSRITSTAGRTHCSNVAELIVSLRREFIEAARFHFPDICGSGDEQYLFLAVFEAFGEREGIELLQEAVDRPATRRMLDDLAPRLDGLLAHIREHGYRPRPLVFAVQRYLRWMRGFVSASRRAHLSEDTTREARATMLRELWETYGLGRLRDLYPELRVRFFRLTVFSDAESDFVAELDRLIEEQRSAGARAVELPARIARLQERAPAGSDREFYLARMAWPYLPDTVPASLTTVQEGSASRADLEVVQHDEEGAEIRIRRAATPREVGLLYRIFQETQLNVHFQPEHEFLLVFDERGREIGGLVYAEEGPERVRLERYVVAPHRRSRGVARLLLEEFFNRMEDRGVRLVRTAFMQPRYHASLGFNVDHVHGGLVKVLSPGIVGSGEDVSA